MGPAGPEGDPGGPGQRGIPGKMVRLFTCTYNQMYQGFHMGQGG